MRRGVPFSSMYSAFALPVRISVIVTWANVVAVMVRAAVPIIEMKRIVYSP